MILLMILCSRPQFRSWLPLCNEAQHIFILQLFDIDLCWSDVSLLVMTVSCCPSTKQTVFLKANQIDSFPPPPLFCSDYRPDMPSLCCRWKQLFDTNWRRKFSKQIKQTFNTKEAFYLAASQEQQRKKMRRAAGKLSLRFLGCSCWFEGIKS